LNWWENKFNAEIEIQGERQGKHEQLQKNLQLLLDENVGLRHTMGRKNKKLQDAVIRGIEAADDDDDEEELVEEEPDTTKMSAEAFQIYKEKKVETLAAQRKMKRAVRQFISDGGTFIYFCVVFSIVAFTSRGDLGELNAFSSILESSFLTPKFQTISSQGEVWDYLQTDFHDLIYQRKWYNGNQFSPHDFGYVMLYNRIVGQIRLRQVRGRRGKCPNLPDGIYTYPCYEKVTDETIEEKPMFVPNATGGPGIIRYWDETQTTFTSYSGQDASYPGGGHVVDLHPTNATSSKIILQNLFDGRWIDEQTRAVFVDVTAFNGNINKFFNMRIVFEFPLAGGVKASLDYAAVKLFRYASRADFFILSFEVLLLLLMLNYVEVQFQKIRNFGLKEYLEDFWTLYDIFNMGTLFTCNGMRIYWVYEVYSLKLQDITDDEFINLHNLSHFVILENSMNSINSLMIYLRAFKFFQLNPRMKTFQNVWGRAGPDLLAFWVLLFVILFSYSSAMYVAFSLKLKNFKTFGESFMMIIQYLVGSYNVDEMREADGFLGVFYVLTFMLQVFFCLMNIPMIIIGDAYIWAYKQKHKKELTYYVREALRDTAEESIPALRKKKEARLAAEERARLMAAGVIIDDIEQQRVLKQVEFVILDIGEEEFQKKLMLAGIPDVNVYGNITKEECKTLSMCLNNIRAGNKI